MKARVSPARPPLHEMLPAQSETQGRMTATGLGERPITALRIRRRGCGARGEWLMQLVPVLGVP